MRWILLLAFLSLLYHYGRAIQCYECNSALNAQCTLDRLPESLRRNCSEHDKGVRHSLCRKIVQHVEFSVNGLPPDFRVIRSCGWDDTRYKGACYQRSGYGGRQEVCTCTTDLCNAAAQQPPAQPTALAALAALASLASLAPPALQMMRCYH